MMPTHLTVTDRSYTFCAIEALKETLQDQKARLRLIDLKYRILATKVWQAGPDPCGIVPFNLPEVLPDDVDPLQFLENIAWLTGIEHDAVPEIAVLRAALGRVPAPPPEPEYPLEAPDNLSDEEPIEEPAQSGEQPMTDTNLTSFLKDVGHRPYKEFVQDHINRNSTEHHQRAVMGEIGLLPASYQSLAMKYIDEVNSILAYDKNFWNTATCHGAFHRIIDIAIGVFPVGNKYRSVEDFVNDHNHVLAFGIFQAATLSFAYSASTQRKQRKFMGIRKGLFG